MSLRFKVNMIKDRFWASTTYNYTYGHDMTDDVPLGHIPPTFGSIRGNYKYKWLEASAFINYNSWKLIEDYSPGGEDNEDEATVDGTPSWYTLNVSSNFRLSEKTSVQLAVQNILDHHYKPFASGISGPGRNVVITGRVSF